MSWQFGITSTASVGGFQTASSLHDWRQSDTSVVLFVWRIHALVLNPNHEPNCPQHPHDPAYVSTSTVLLCNVVTVEGSAT
jgi:hypothetical protein